MSINPEYDGTVTLRPYPNGAESEQAAAVAVDQAPPVTPAELNPPAQAIQPAYLPEAPRFEAITPCARCWSHAIDRPTGERRPTPELCVAE